MRPQLLLLSKNDFEIVGTLQSSIAVTEATSPVVITVGLQPRSWSAAHFVNVGGVVFAVQVMCWTQVALLPQASVAT